MRIGFFDFSENQRVPICEDEIYFTDLAAPTMGQYFMGTGRIAVNNRVLDRETRQVICFPLNAFFCICLICLSLSFEPKRHLINFAPRQPVGPGHGVGCILHPKV